MQHKEGKFYKLAVKNISQQIHSEQTVDQLSSDIIGAIHISTPQEYNMTIYRNAQLAFVMQCLEEGKVHNLENKAQMTLIDGELTTVAQHQEEDEAQKLMVKEQRAITSTLKREYLLLVQRVLSLRHFLQPSIPQNLGFASKLTTLAMDSMSFLADHLLHLQAVFRVAEKNSTFDVGFHNTNFSSIEMIYTKKLMNYTEKITNRETANFSGVPIYDIWSLLFILYHLIFGSLIFNFDSQHINILLSILIYHCFHFLQCLWFYV